MHDVLRERSSRVFDYLRELRALREPPTRDVLAYAPRYSQYRITDLPKVPQIRSGVSSQGWWLSVTKPPRQQAPPVPDDLRSFVLEGGSDPLAPPQLDEALPELVEQDLEQEEEIRNLYQRWLLEEWSPWFEKVSPVLRARKFYEALYELRLKLNREEAETELVWGHGTLVWSPVDGRLVRYPLLTTRCALEFDTETGALRVLPIADTELHLLPLQGLPVQTDRLAQERERYREFPIDPWSSEDATTLYRRILNILDVEGQLCGEETLPAPRRTPAIVDTSILFARPRSTMYARFFEEMQEAITGGGLLPPPLAAAIADEPSSLHGEMLSSEEIAAWLDSERRLMMPLPVNDEQQQIAFRLARNIGVTVQGPPGTGKTHTIANLICHLIAHGKRVLVTAHKEQPLLVLRDKIPKELQPLCVAVLGSSSQTMAQLDQSLQTISSKAATLDQDRTRNRIAELSKRVDEKNQELAGFRRRQVSLARGETDTYILDGNELTPSELAEWLKSTEGYLGHIPDDIALNEDCPLTSTQFAELSSLEAALGEDDRRSLKRRLPDPEHLPAGTEVGAALKRLGEVSDNTKRLRLLVRGWAQVDGTDSDSLESLAEELAAAGNRLAKVEGTWLWRVIGTPAAKVEWRELCVEVAGDVAYIRERRARVARHTVTLPNGGAASRTVIDELVKLAGQLAGGRSLGLFAPKRLKALREQTLLDGEPVRNEADCRLALDYATMVHRRLEMLNRWNEASGRVQGPILDGEEPPEDVLSEYAEEVGALIGWLEEDWLRLIGRVEELSLSVPQLGSSELADLSLVVRGLKDRHEETRLSAWLKALDGKLKSQGGEGTPSPLFAKLRDALRQHESTAWGAARDEVLRLQALAPDAQRADELEATLAEGAPLLAKQLRKLRGEFPTAPKDLPDAWKWRQAETWLRGIIGQDDSAALAKKQAGAREAIEHAMTELVVDSAWLQVAQGLTDERRRAMAAWAQALRKIGKGTGKYAAKWRAEANNAMHDASAAIPVWVMPMYRVVESFTADQPPFDVVIVDESSQCDVSALAALGLARKAVIVGDDKQISPQAVGVNLGEADDLATQHLAGVAYAKLLDPKSSLYDLAKRTFPGVIVLREHFRCLPEIIQFSNDLCYDGQIRPLREELPDPHWQAVVDCYVESGFRDGSSRINRPEAEAIVEKMLELARDPLYRDKSMGVITLLDGDQGRHIEERLISELGEREMEQRRIRCGDAYDFQGDERDIIFLSMVTATVDSFGNAIRQGAFTKESDVQRINVAASRARDQIRLYRSVNPSDLPQGDVRARLIDYCRKPAGSHKRLEDLAEKCESQFERDILTRLLARAYRVDVQYRVGHYRIDLVVRGRRKRLAIECDGDAWHGDEHWEQDVDRQAVLERLGWKFFRIRGSQYYRDPDAAMAPLWAFLNSLGIEHAMEEPKASSDAPKAGAQRYSEDVIPEDPATVADLTVPVASSVSPVVPPHSERPAISQDRPVTAKAERESGNRPQERSDTRAATALTPEQSRGAREVRPRKLVPDPSRPASARRVATSLRGQTASERPTSAPTGEDDFHGKPFAEVPLGFVAMQIATLVSERGTLSKADLVAAYAEQFGVVLAPRDRRWLDLFAWSAVGHKFALWNEDSTVLEPGPKPAVPVDPPGRWTFNQIVGCALGHHREGAREAALFEAVLGDVFPGGVRVPKLMRRIVGSAINEAEKRDS